jgi:copper(I)-binding protein
MKLFTQSVAIAALSMAAWSAQAQVTIDDAWVRATVPNQPATGAFMQLTSRTDAKLVAVESPVAKAGEVHEMAMQNDVMKMRQIEGLALPAGQRVELRPGGYHVMLMGLHQQVKDGDKVPLTLVFEGADGKRESVSIEAPVRPLNSAGAGSHAHGHKH